MTANEMSDIIDANSKDIDWIREMNFRLREASEAKVAGEGAVVPQLKDLASTNAEFMTSESYAGRGRALLEEQHAALVQEIDDLLKDSAAVKQYGYRAENIEVITLPAGRNRPINEIVGLRIDGDLTIPVIDGNGGIRLEAPSRTPASPASSCSTAAMSAPMSTACAACAMGKTSCATS